MDTCDAIRRVALVSPTWPRDVHANGIATYVDLMRAGLHQLGIASSVAAFNCAHGEGATLLGGSLTQKNAAAKFLTRLSWRLIPHLAGKVVPVIDVMHGIRCLERDWKFNILETEESFGFARWMSRIVHAPTIVRLHGPWILNGVALGVPRDDVFYARVAAEGRAIEAAEAVSAPCRDVIEQVRRYYGLKLPNAVVIPNPGPEPDTACLWDLKAAEPGHLVFVGRFDRHKGGDVMVDAFASLASRYPLLKLTMAGPDTGFLDESGRRWSFSEYVAAKVPMAHRERIEFLGHVTPGSLVELRRRASVVISAARYENFPMAVLEALSQGCPVVCPGVGGLPEMVEDGVSGLLFTAGDANSLADRIKVLIDAPARAAELGEQAQRLYRAKFLPQRVAEQTVAFYRDVCQQRRAKLRGQR